MLTIEDIVKKRRELWQKTKDSALDKELVDSIAHKILTSENLRSAIQKEPYLLIECCFSVVDKKRQRIPFFFNTVQRDFISKIQTLGRQKPYFVLKGRQQGFTTLITAIQLSYAVVCRNFAGFTVADRDDNTRSIFVDKAKTMYNDLPKILKPTEKFNSIAELYFDKLNSSWRIASASANVGRSRTLSFIHFSEAAFYKCPLSELQKSILESSVENALCIYETTANGLNDAKALWDSGSCHNLFYEWWKSDEYRCDDLSYLKTEDKWLKARLAALKSRGLQDSQLAWYAKKYSSYIDKSAIKQEYPCSPEEAFIVSSDSIFDKEAIGNYLSNFDVLSTQGSFKYKKSYVPSYSPEGEICGYETKISDVEFVKDPQGMVSIVENPYRLEKGGLLYEKPYVIGADTAGFGQDYFTAKVIDNTSGRCVATLRKQCIDEDLYAIQLYCLGKYYNNAQIAVETNYSRHPVNVLFSLGYPRLYSQGNEDGGEFRKSRLGFTTSALTRPLIISNLVATMRDNLHLETDRETLKELLSFVRHPNGKAAAAQNAHDDLVMASAIAHYTSRFFTHEMQITDTGSGFFTKSNTNSSPEYNDFMEW